MTQYIDVTGKTEEEAIEKALAQLSLDRDEVSVEVLERARTGFLGLGASPAKVRVRYDDGMSEPPAVVFQPEQRKTREEREEAERKERMAAAAAKANAPRASLSYQPEVLQNKNAATGTADKSGREKPRPERPVRAPKPNAEPLEEARDEKAGQIRTFLNGLLAHLECEAAVRVYESEKGRYQVVLEGEKLGALIGRRGETLDAIQQLTGYAVNRSSDKNRVRVQVDAENYREKREQSLTRMANKVAAKVIKLRKNVTLEPMNAYERHVVHTALQDMKNISTFSIGTEPNRRVVVAYDRGKKTPQGAE